MKAKFMRSTDIGYVTYGKIYEVFDDHPELYGFTNDSGDFDHAPITSFEIVEENPKKPAKPKIELTVKNTVFINGVEMRKFELIDLRNKIDDVVAKMD